MSPASAISLLVFASLLLGLVRDLAVAYYFGAGWAADLYFFALIIPLFFENSLAVSLRDALVPALIHKREEGPGPYHALIARLGGIVVLLSLLLATGFALTASFWVGVLGTGPAPGGSPVAVAYALGIAMIPLATWSYFLASVCHTENRFVLPAWRGVLFNLGGLLALVLFWRSTEGLLAGMLVGQLLHILVVHRELRFVRLRPSASASPLRDDLRDLMPQFLTLLAVALLLQLGISVERLLASWTGEGGLARLSYAFRIVTVPLVVFTFAVLGIAHARFSRAKAAADGKGLQLAIRDTTRICFYLLLPAGVGIHVFSGDVLSLLLRRGAFTPGDVELTARVMEAYALGLPAMGLLVLLGRLHVAGRHLRRLLLCTLAGVGLMCAGYFAVYARHGIEGLALVTTAGAVLQCLLLWVCLPTDLRALLSRRDVGGLALMLLLQVLVVQPFAGHGLPGLLAGGLLSLVLPVLVLLALERREFFLTVERSLGKQKGSIADDDC